MALVACEKDIAPEPCQNPLDPNCVNYHPCNGQEPTSAAFTMEEVVNAPTNGWPTLDRIVYDTDTCSRWNNFIVFTCTQKADSIWWIFDDTEMRPEWQQKQSFSIRFGSPGGPLQTEPERVKITCVVKNNKPNPCFPDDNGIDTFTRYMVYMPWWQMGFIGTFRGSLTHNPDSMFDLEIRWDTLIINNEIQRYFIRFDNLLVAPPFYTTDFLMHEGQEYRNELQYGYRGAYLDFLTIRPPLKYNYKGVDQRCKAFYNSQGNFRIDFVRGAPEISTMNQWPPQGYTLQTFIGKKK
jgi:hypothetical protein